MSAPCPTPDPAAARPRPTFQDPPDSPDRLAQPSAPPLGPPVSPADPAPAGGIPPPEDLPREQPRLQHPARGRRYARKDEAPASPLTAEQRLLVLDAWRRSGLPAGDFAPLVGVSKHTLYAWKRKFEAEGPAGLLDKARGGPAGTRLPEATRRAILLIGGSGNDLSIAGTGDDIVIAGVLLPCVGPQPGSWADPRCRTLPFISCLPPRRFGVGA